MTSASVNAIINQASLSKKHLLFWLLASGGIFLDGFCVLSLGVAFPMIHQTFAISPLMTGLIGSTMVVSIGLGAIIGGRMADKHGRKKMMLIDVCSIIIGAVISVLAKDPTMILIGQFLIGLGIGIDFPVSSTYVSELMPKKQRSRMLVGVITFQSIGLITAAVVCILVLKFLVKGEQGWRYLFAMEGFVAAALLILRSQLPESAIWLAYKNRFAKAAMVLRTLCPDFNGDANTLQKATKADKITRKVKQSEVETAKLSEIFSTKYRKQTLFCALPWFLQDIATYGIGLFTPVILVTVMSDMQHQNANIISKEIISAKGSGLVDLFLLFGFLLGLYVVPKFGRVRMQMLGFIGMAVGMAMLSFASYSQSGASANIALVFCGFVIFNLMMNMGPNATTFSQAAHIFPTRMRGTAGGFAAMCAKCGAACGTFFLPIISAKFGTPFVLMLTAIVSFSGFLATYLLGRQFAHHDDSN